MFCHVQFNNRETIFKTTFSFSCCYQSTIDFYFGHKSRKLHNVTVATMTFSVKIIFSVSNLFAWCDRCSSRLSVQVCELFLFLFLLTVNV